MDKSKWHDGLFGLVACSTPATISSLASATLYSFEYKRYMDIRQMTEMFTCDASTEDGALKQHISGEDYALISILPACLFYYDVLHNEGTTPVPATEATTKAVLKETPASCSDNPTAMSACGGQICNFRRDPRSVAGVTEDEALSLIHDIAAVACYSFELEMVIRKSGYKMSLTHHMFLPSSELINIDTSLKIKWLEQDEIMDYYGREEFSNAICDCFHPDRPDVLAVVALDGNVIMGMAGCSADSPKLWQIGIDVNPIYRGRGIAKTLVTLLRNEVLLRGAIPYYGTSLSNLASWKTALSSGFAPAWIEVESRKIVFK